MIPFVQPQAQVWGPCRRSLFFGRNKMNAIVTLDIAKITAMLAIGQLSIDLRAAELAADSAKWAYHVAWHQFELDGEVGDPDGEDRSVAPDERVRPGHPRWSDAQEATATQFSAYQAAKRAAYNVKRRWQNACRKAGDLR